MLFIREKRKTQFIRIILRDICDEYVHFFASHSMLAISFLSLSLYLSLSFCSDLRAIYHGYVSAAADRLKASRYIRLIPSHPSASSLFLVNSFFIHLTRVSERIFICPLERRCLSLSRCISWDRFIWNCLTCRACDVHAARLARVDALVNASVERYC